MADLFLHVLSEPRLTWSMGSGKRSDSEVRATYIAALVAFDVPATRETRSVGLIELCWFEVVV